MHYTVSQNTHSTTVNMPDVDNFQHTVTDRFINKFCRKMIFSALMLLVGRQEGYLAGKKQWWSAGEVVCLQQGAELHMAQLMPLPLLCAVTFPYFLQQCSDHLPSV